MLVALTIAFALQATVRVGGETQGGQGDSARQARRDSIRVEMEQRRRDRERRPARRIAVTPELERSAFLDAGARELLLSARDARMRQDSTLASYDASTYQRVSIGIGFRAIGRDRLLFRTESASRVRWSRGGGAVVDLKGRRSVSPAFPDAEGEADLHEMTALPYYPGREALWIGGQEARAEVDDRELVHPIALGSEAYYRFASGDSLDFTLPDGARIRLRELRVEPRRPEWRLSVGSFWFDQSTGQLVRAVYRLAVPIDVWAIAEEESRRAKSDTSYRSGGMAGEFREMDEEDDIPGWVKAMMSPLQANLEAVTIEYGLYGGRFWLPRAQYAEGWARASFMRVPFRIEESFKYASVNGGEEMPVVPERRLSVRDSLFANDSTPWRMLPPEERRRRVQVMVDAEQDRRRAREAQREAECASSGSYTADVHERETSGLRVALRIPCDTTVLSKSPDLPPSIYDSGEELFGASERLELLKALNFSLQPGWAPQPIAWQYGLPLTRYNRIEGFSTGIGASMQLGQGYAWDGQVRLGTGDWEPNAELGFSRSNGRRTWRLAGYRQLAVASDWGPTPSFGGLGALLFGRDDAFYYRTTGVELERFDPAGAGTTLRFFAEHDSPVSVTTSFNVARALGSASEFGANFEAVRGNTYGLQWRDTRSFGLDPRGWRAFGNLLLEGGWFDPKDETTADAHAFSRAAADLTVSRGLGKRLSAALTMAGGVADHAPVQRHFFVGGTPTVRGQLAGSAVGDTYWLGRLEIGGGNPAFRPVVFGDIGWAGPRALWKTPGRPLSGAGVGLSFLDGLVRADLARGIYPREKMRFDMYFEARW